MDALATCEVKEGDGADSDAAADGKRKDEFRVCGPGAGFRLPIAPYTESKPCVMLTRG